MAMLFAILSWPLLGLARPRISPLYSMSIRDSLKSCEIFFAYLGHVERAEVALLIGGIIRCLSQQHYNNYLIILRFAVLVNKHGDGV